jgi:hypothetical protein
MKSNIIMALLGVTFAGQQIRPRRHMFFLDEAEEEVQNSLEDMTPEDAA